MYHEYYNLELLPFENTPDPRFFFASEQHREALAAIEYTIRMRKGITLVTGAIGSGKTTIGRTMCERCADHATIVQLYHGHRGADELLTHLLRAINVKYGRKDDHARKLERLSNMLRKQAQQRRPLVLFVDEAQTLSDDALEELRLLTNFDLNTQKLLQLVLVGQPELRERIRSPRLLPLRQRIVMAKQLRPLNVNDTGQYIAHRLRAASRDKDNVQVHFTPEAVSEVYRHTGGVPRLINVVCDNCLLLSFVRESREVTPNMVRRVVDDMVPSFEGSPVDEQDVHPPLRMAGGF